MTKRNKKEEEALAFSLIDNFMQRLAYDEMVKEASALPEGDERTRAMFEALKYYSMVESERKQIAIERLIARTPITDK